MAPTGRAVGCRIDEGLVSAMRQTLLAGCGAVEDAR
jgi:hypothetical protein